MSTFEYAIAGAADRVELPSRFDVLSSAAYRMPFLRMIRDPGKRLLMLDLGRVTYIDSCGVGTLIAWRKACEECGKELRLCNCGRVVMDTLRMLGVERLIAADDAVMAD